MSCRIPYTAVEWRTFQDGKSYASPTAALRPLGGPGGRFSVYGSSNPPGERSRLMHRLIAESETPSVTVLRTSLSITPAALLELQPATTWTGIVSPYFR